MIKKYKIVGLDCPNCAKTLEKEISKQSEVKNAEIDFVKECLYIESDNQPIAYKQAISVANAIEPDAKILELETESKSFTKKTLIEMLILLFGIALSAVTLFVPMPNMLFWFLYVLSAIIVGYKTYIKAIKQIFKGVVNENLLIMLSTIGAACVGEYLEGLMVICLYSIGKLLETLALNKSKKSIENLLNLKPESVTMLIDGKQKIVSPNEVNVGDIILVKPGERVPVDSVILNGQTLLNMQNLTGESLPVFVKENDQVLSGSIVIDGILTLKVKSIYSDSAIAKILNLIENAQEKKSKTETIISKIARWFTYVVMLLAVVVFGIVWLATNNLNTAVYRGLIFLVVSCPCAFAISVPLSYFSGLGNASNNGILIKGSNYLDALSKVNVVAFDKTGTLTNGKFVIEKVNVLSKKYSEEDIIFLASLGEQFSNHPLAKAIVNKNKRVLEGVKNFKEVAGEGVYFSYKKNKYFIGKKDDFLSSTTVEVYENKTKIAEIYMCDEIKHTSFDAIKNLNSLGIKTVLLSGDKKETVTNLANSIKIDSYYYNMLPEDKYKYIENLKNQKKYIAYVGDGINDAPSLSLADVGISMGINGSEASINASDIVLVDDNPNNVYKAIQISKQTRKIVFENIIASAVIKVAFLTLGALGITGMLSAVIADVGVTLVAIVNSLRALKIKNKKQILKNSWQMFFVELNYIWIYKNS